MALPVGILLIAAVATLVVEELEELFSCQQILFKEMDNF
jgi:hypothetical protein